MSKSKKEIAAERKERWGNPENFTFVPTQKDQKSTPKSEKTKDS